VKTTPKPSATKKSSGELVGPLLLLLLLVFVAGALGEGVASATDEDMAACGCSQAAIHGLCVLCDLLFNVSRSSRNETVPATDETRLRRQDNVWSKNWPVVADVIATGMQL
jgi:hypothetical protein